MDLLKREIEKKGALTRESRRLFHGRGHCFSGYEDILVDWFDPIILVTLYRPRSENWICDLASWLQHRYIAAAVIVQERFLPTSPSRVIVGTLPDEVCAVENSLKYRLRLTAAQNIGFFLDMAVGRNLIREMANGKKVLNLFSYTCSFSVAAIAAGARQVVNVDMNRGALKLGEYNHQLNCLDLRCASFLSFEIFRSFSRLARLAPFDMIICDPPDEQGSSFRPQRDWPRLARKLPQLLSSCGQLYLCLSSPHIRSAEIEELFKDLSLAGRYRSGDDFPESEPEKGLNILHYCSG